MYIDGIFVTLFSFYCILYTHIEIHSFDQKYRPIFLRSIKIVYPNRCNLRYFWYILHLFCSIKNIDAWLMVVHRMPCEMFIAPMKGVRVGEEDEDCFWIVNDVKNIFLDLAPSACQIQSPVCFMEKIFIFLFIIHALASNLYVSLMLWI